MRRERLRDATDKEHDLIVYTTLSAILGLLGGYLAIQAQEFRLKIILGALALALLLGIVRLFPARPFTER